MVLDYQDPIILVFQDGRKQFYGENADPYITGFPHGSGIECLSQISGFSLSNPTFSELPDLIAKSILVLVFQLINAVGKFFQFHSF